MEGVCVCRGGGGGGGGGGVAPKGSGLQLEYQHHPMNGVASFQVLRRVCVGGGGVSRSLL